MSALAESISNEINTALGSDEINQETSILIASALESLNNEINQLKSETSQGGNILSDLRTTFDNFAQSVRPVTEIPDETEPPITDETPIVPGDQLEEILPDNTSGPIDEIPVEETAQFSVEQFLTDLMTTFETELGLLEMTLTNSQIMPEITEPNGSGKSYDKFISIYNEMKSNIESNAQVSQTSDIDIIS